MADDRRLLIAQFARYCRLPVSTLRYYDTIGLLRPASVDPHSGYRYYTVGQLPVAVFIARLRTIGTDPGTIASVLAGGDEATVALGAERDRLCAEIAERRRALALLETFSDPPTESRSVPEAVALADELVASRGFTTTFSDLTTTITRTIAGLRTCLRRTGADVLGWGALLPLDLRTTVTGTVFARLDGPDLDRVSPMIRLPVGPAMTAHHRGDLADLPFGYAAVLTAIEAQGTEPLSPVIEDYELATIRRTTSRTRITVPFR